MEDLHEDMEDFIIAGLADLVAELGEGSLGGDMIRIDARIGAIAPPLVFVLDNREKLGHFPVAVDIAEEIDKKDTYRVKGGSAEG